MKKKLYVIDGNSLLNRAFYALPLLSNSNGVYLNAVFGFSNFLVRLITTEKPDGIVVAFDHARKTFRNEIFAEYKGTRKQTPFELIGQFDTLKTVLDAMGITYFEQAGIEADDIIGTIVKHSDAQNFILTGDRDALQLIDQNTCVCLTQKGLTDIKLVNLENIQELYGMTPSQIIDFKALAGDKSDNIPGVPGVGDISAINYLKKYQNVENLYQHLDDFKGKAQEKLVEGKDSCFMSRKLATIKTDCDINFDITKCGYIFPFSNQVRELFEKFEFKTILKRTTLFSHKANDMQVPDITCVTSEEALENLLKDFSDKVFCFDAKDTFEFCVNKRRYEIKYQEFGSHNIEAMYQTILKYISPLLIDDNVLKIVPDLKACMHKLKTDKIDNAFDISLADYLLSGGNKPEAFKDSSTFEQIYNTQIEKLKQDNLHDLYFKIELPLEYLLYQMENEGFAVDKDILAHMEQTYAKELSDLETQFKQYSSNPDINIKSPKQIAQLLFDELKLSDKFNKKHSTNVEALSHLADAHPVVPIILRHRKVSKLYLSYLDPYTQMLKESKGNLIYTLFNQTQTATGRLSSSEPNLQNIPVRSEEGRCLRKIFKSRFDGGKIMSFDYNQIELRLLANFSNDQKLINDYNSGADIHAITASQIFNIAPHEVTDLQRRTAKAVNFGIIYGISGFGLSKNIEIPVKDAKEYINLYFTKYPVVKEYLDNLVESAKELGYAKSLFERRRYIPELKSSIGLQKMLGERLAMNMPLQGSASDLIKLAMLNVNKRFKKENINSKLILQIHDELVVDACPTEEEIVKKIVLEEMQNVYEFKVPLLVSVGVGKTWYECK
ncbi:MAG: DNA polymerase I [Clostridia bacterium]|nr:DNA polymerase I [Clostridia bacterium]